MKRQKNESVSGTFKNIANATWNSNSKLNHHKCFPTDCNFNIDGRRNNKTSY